LHPTTSSPDGVLATRREWLGLGVITIACMLYSMDLSVLFLAVPSIVKDLKPTPTQLLWINDIYGFMVAGFLVTMGSLGDRIGRRKVLLIGAAAFGATSCLAAFSTSPNMLILARALQGIAGATIAPSTLSLVFSMFPNEAEKNRAMGIWGTGFAVGGLVGPVIGGVLLQYFGWGSVFLINVPIMAALLIVAPYLLPEYKSENGGRLDLISVALSLGTILPIIFGLKQLAAYGLAAAPFGAIVLGLIFGYQFIRRQKMLIDPMIDLALFKVPAFNTALLVNLAGIFFVFAVFLYQNQYLQLVLDLSPLAAGLWSIIPSLIFTFMSLYSHKFISRFGASQAVIGGLIINAIAFAAMAAAAIAANLYGILGAAMLIGLGFVPVILTTMNMIVSSAPIDRAGAASAISETSAELGGALGIAIMGSLATLIYRYGMADIDLTGIPPQAATAARATLAGAVESAIPYAGDHIPWLDVAKDSFSASFAMICITGTLSFLALAFLVHKVFDKPATNETMA
jgi:MFS transporter, DHA2 family, multidrug resistance protein